MTRNTQYNIHLGKGCGLVEETLSLLSICNEHTTKESLAKYVHESNFLGKSTDQRSMDIVKLVFYPRFMKNNPKVPLWLKAIREKGLMLPQFKQLLMLYCARENAVFYDYITTRLNDWKRRNVVQIPQDDIKKYIEGIVSEDKAKWSDSIKKRNSNYVKAALIDFDLINKKGDRLSYEISDFVVLYLMHELHFDGLSDMAIWDYEDWQLFGLDKYGVQEKIMGLNLKGGYIAQSSGDLMTISWKYNNMEEFINGTL